MKMPLSQKIFSRINKSLSPFNIRFFYKFLNVRTGLGLLALADISISGFRLVRGYPKTNEISLLCRFHAVLMSLLKCGGRFNGVVSRHDQQCRQQGLRPFGSRMIRA